MTPGKYKQKAKGLVIEYGFHPTPLGECFIALTDRGLCQLSFVDGVQHKETLDNFRELWRNAELKINQARTKKYVGQIFGPKPNKAGLPINLFCRGTAFQIKVWEALLKIPAGRVVSYKTIARMIGRPKAARAVGGAVGRNPIAYLIPCHRVIRELGAIGGYRWGIDRKRAILAREAVGYHG